MQRYCFENIPKISNTHANLISTFSNYLDTRPARIVEIRRAFQKMAMTCLKVRVDFSIDGYRLATDQEIKSRIPAFPVIMEVGLHPAEKQILVELDPPICMGIIDNLLGGHSKPMRIQRSLTDIELGVLSFFVLQSLSIVQGDANNGNNQALRLERFYSTGEEISQRISQDTSYLVMLCRIYYGDIVGYFRLYIPADIIATTFASPLPQSGAGDVSRMQRLLNRVSPLPVALRAAFATIHLDAADISALEVGDIVLLEESDVSIHDGLSGTVKLTVDPAGKSTIYANFINNNGLFDLQIQDIAVVEEPMAADANQQIEVEEGQLPPQENLGENEGMLQDVQSPIVVELGRIKTNAAQLIRMHPGQILRLSRGPDEPVELVVNNKVFARGILIEVEGELGVRISEMA